MHGNSPAITDATCYDLCRVVVDNGAIMWSFGIKRSLHTYRGKNTSVQQSKEINIVHRGNVNAAAMTSYLAVFSAAIAIFGTIIPMPVSAQDELREFSYGITGSVGSVETDNPGFYFKKTEVQALVIDMIPGSIPAIEVER